MSAIVVALVLGSIIPWSTNPVLASSITTHADSVGIAFYTSGINPHYGAFFTGRNGRHQFYTGPNGPAGYSTWDWWGNNMSVLLLQKRWYLITSGANNPYHHNATVNCPC